MELCPLVLVVSGTLPLCASDQWNSVPLCWWSVELFPLVLEVSGTLPLCADGQWKLCYCVFLLRQKMLMYGVVFSKLKPQYSDLIAVLAL
ncbi:unnamed protein product, partial [Staurois parvus]